MSDNLRAWAHWVLAEHPPADADRKQMALDVCAMVKRNKRLEAVLAAARKYCTQADKPIPQKPDAEIKRFKLNLANGSKLREAIRLCDSQEDGK